MTPNDNAATPGEEDAAQESSARAANMITPSSLGWPARLDVTLGAGLKGRGAKYGKERCTINLDSFDALEDFSAGLPFEEDGWWAANLWSRNHRKGDKWEGSGAIVVDLDWEELDSEGKHTKHEPTAEDREKVEALFADLPVQFHHRTKHGFRLIALLREPVTDPKLFAAAAKGIEFLILTALADAPQAQVGSPGVKLDPVTDDLARVMRRPRCDVKVKGSRKPYRLEEVIHVLPNQVASAEEFREITERAHDAEKQQHLLAGTTAVAWPNPITGPAYHGVLGEIVRLIAPCTEADPAALLLQLIVGFGSAAGNAAWFTVEGARHHANLFAVIVGDSSKARKGTSWAIARNVLCRADKGWAKDNIAAGLSSGEGIIFAVRDATDEGEKPDPGVIDKRLLIAESEFGGALKVLRRDGNTLSAVLRCAWDRGDLRTLTRKAALRATGAHISLIGHIVGGELRRYLSETEILNGFANRALWCCARRSRLLPEGGRLPWADLDPHIAALTRALEFAEQAGEIKRSDPARALWRERYEQLSASAPGAFGSATSRGEAQVVRLSLVYALLDRSTSIGVEHLQAALEVWRYCQDSARHIFGTSLGDPVADEIVELLSEKPNGATRTDIRNHFKRHRSKAEIDQAIAVIQTNGLASAEKQATGGRPSVRWRLLRNATKASEATNGGNPGLAVRANRAESAT